MRSVLSLMAEFGSPTMLKPGKPLVKVLSTSIIQSSSLRLTVFNFRLNLAFCHSFLPFGRL